MKIASQIYPFILLFMLFSAQGTSQELVMDSVIYPLDQRPPSFEQFLVQLAWMNSPENKVFEHGITVAEQDIKKARKFWLSGTFLSIGFGNNRSSNDVTDPDNYNLNSGVNMGLGISLGGIIQQGNVVKTEKEKLKIAISEANQQKIVVKSKTRQAYHSYQGALEIMKIQTEMLAESEINYDLIKELFKQNKASISDLNSAQSAHSQFRQRHQHAKNELKLKEILLEEIIGTPLENAALHYYQ